MSKTNEYRPGNPEYDYWNDKNLYPSLRHDFDEPFPGSTNSNSIPSDDQKIGFGSFFTAFFLWFFFTAPLALILTWQNWFFQLLFWGGLAILLLILIVAFYNNIQDEKQHKK